jgi:CheY-like chemotaxis protein
LEDPQVILVVEDDPLVQRVVAVIFSGGGFAIAIASSGEQALELLGAADGKYRAVVTDINLGRDKMDGWEVAKRARELDPEFPVVYMSGDSTADWPSKGVPNSILLSKPFAPTQLLRAVSLLLNSGTPTT